MGDSICKKNKQEILSEISYVKINGVTLKVKHLLFLYNDTDQNPVFGIIQKLLKNEKKELLVSFQKCVTIGYIHHIKSYEISLPKKNVKHIYYKLNFNNYIKPIKIHITSEGVRVVTRRDLH